MYMEDLCITEVALPIREGIPQVMLGQLITTLHIQNNILANVYRSYYVPGTILYVLHVFIFLQMCISNPYISPELQTNISNCLLNRFGKGNGTPLQYSCLENAMDRGAWWAAVHGVAKSQTHWVTSLSLSCVGEGNGNLLQYSCLENPRDGGAWWAAVYGGHTESDTTEVTQQQ